MVVYGSSWEHFFQFTFSIILTAVASFSLGHVFSVIANDINTAISLATPVLATQLLFSGFFMDKTKHTPKWLNNLRYFSVINYSFDLMMINQWSSVTQFQCEYDLELLCLTSGKDVLLDFDIQPVILS